MTTTKRGIVLRVPEDGPGLLLVEGRQLRFYLDGLLRSPLPPKPGSVEEIELNRNSVLVGVVCPNAAGFVIP